MLSHVKGMMGRIVLLRGTQVRTAKIIGGNASELFVRSIDGKDFKCYHDNVEYIYCLLYTSPSPRDGTSSRMPSSA